MVSGYNNLYGSFIILICIIYLDFASSSFDAILFPQMPEQEEKEAVPGEPIKRRASHLPDLIPFISLITEKCSIQPVNLVMALIYVQRFRKTLPAAYQAEAEAAHRIFAASLLVASKYIEDKCLSTKQVVRATGDVWSIKEMTQMELAFLRFLQWDLYVSPREMELFIKDLGFDPNEILPNISLSSLEDDTF